MGDEKLMPYRKGNLSQSAGALDEHEPLTDSLDPSAAALLEEGAAESEHEHIKSLFCSMMDAQPKVRLGYVAFTWTEPNDSHLTVKSLKPADKSE